MRKRRPRLEGGGYYMNDVERKFLRKAQFNLPGTGGTTETSSTQTDSTGVNYDLIFNDPNRTYPRPYEATGDGYLFLDDNSTLTYDQVDSLGNLYGTQQPLFMMTPENRIQYEINRNKP